MRKKFNFNQPMFFIQKNELGKIHDIYNEVLKKNVVSASKSLELCARTKCDDEWFENKKSLELWYLSENRIDQLTHRYITDKTEKIHNIIANYVNRIIYFPGQFFLRNIDEVEKVVMLRLLVEMREVNSGYYNFECQRGQSDNLKKNNNVFWKEFSLKGRDRFGMHIKNEEGKEIKTVELFGFGKIGKDEVEENSEIGEPKIVHCLEMYKNYYAFLIREGNMIGNCNISDKTMNDRHSMIFKEHETLLLNLLHFDLFGTNTIGRIFAILSEAINKKVISENKKHGIDIFKEIQKLVEKISVIKDDLIRVLLIEELLYPIWGKCVEDIGDYIKETNKYIEEQAEKGRNPLCDIENKYNKIIHDIYLGINNVELKYSDLEKNVKRVLLYKMGYRAESEEDRKREVKLLDLNTDCIDFEFYIKDLKDIKNIEMPNHRDLFKSIYRGVEW